MRIEVFKGNKDVKTYGWTIEDINYIIGYVRFFNIDPIVFYYYSRMDDNITAWKRTGGKPHEGFIMKGSFILELEKHGIITIENKDEMLELQRSIK